MQAKDENTYRNPKRINEPTTIIIFPALQIVPILVVMGCGMVLDQTKLALYFSIGWFYLSRYFLKHSSPEVLLHMLWAKGILDIAVKQTKTCVNPLIKRYHS